LLGALHYSSLPRRKRNARTGKKHPSKPVAGVSLPVFGALRFVDRTGMRAPNGQAPPGLQGLLILMAEADVSQD